MADISRSEVAHLADLARLALSDEELDHLGTQIINIVDHVEAVQEVDTEGVEPMSHPHSVSTGMREDVVKPSLTPEQALDQAPDSAEQRFAVPRILGE
ncbi:MULTISPECIES: Asp-tRNA(Asn)/Glu-tRNA(Gln) amidotransferase subunit GatC [Corynebacterium]|uniref:Asp-tRNA(Asn)/Glu-tRNA(Gln) amidotransferase subunit GatC n=1 Tax=Corynebacterium TaxID=1716 RepID=UPI00124CE8FE|nr:MULTISPECIES: Asp-tRNA(Asn)/Glu-tRNA(Gln) amidotransferase subunit GatC [Corynebacterium]MBV7281480.1 Asp-tRNA(Asn)/Glu-tRNA(Gln) amidotransferase subunit GatC [Corynebacterium sp. TAE3-ERU30]MBV7301120.1 Asp-tRNA(Asn)/Glu-tRNA(Gln) amidotransferase subunit GatC [Corynebacterium sp. TAE3-ERU2]